MIPAHLSLRDSMIHSFRSPIKNCVFFHVLCRLFQIIVDVLLYIMISNSITYLFLKKMFLKIIMNFLFADISLCSVLCSHSPTYCTFGECLSVFAIVLLRRFIFVDWFCNIACHCSWKLSWIKFWF